jgi:hypothetical protein
MLCFIKRKNSLRGVYFHWKYLQIFCAAIRAFEITSKYNIFYHALKFLIVVKLNPELSTDTTECILFGTGVIVLRNQPKCNFIFLFPLSSTEAASTQAGNIA